ncbi:MAG: DUF1802 family protein [Methanobacteriaceae archaeon]
MVELPLAPIGRIIKNAGAKRVSPEAEKVLIKYYATLENILEKPISRIPSDKYYIWTRGHVKKYITSETAFIWALRVYNLQEPYWAENTPGAIRYTNLKEEVSIEGLEPVLSGSEFAKVFIEM